MTLWMVRGGRYGEHEALALENNLACIIEQVPDISSADSLGKIAALVSDSYPEAPKGRVHNLAGQLFSFGHRTELGDLVDAILRVYDELSDTLQGELPLKRMWALVLEE